MDFRDKTCGECAWIRNIQSSSHYSTSNNFRCINAKCNFGSAAILKSTKACPAFEPMVLEVPDADQS